MFLRKAESYQATVTSSTAGVFYSVIDVETKEIDPAYQCIAIAYGKVATSETKISANGDYSSKLGMFEEPSVYLVLQLHYQVEGGRILARLSPTRFEFNAPMSPSGNNKDIVTTVTLMFSTIAESGLVESTAVFIMPTLSNLILGTKMTGQSLQSVSSPWRELPVPGRLVMDALESPADDIQVMPVAVTTTFAETERGNGQAIFVALTEALTSSKSDLGNIVTDAVNELE